MDILDLEMEQRSSKMDTLKEQLRQMEEEQQKSEQARQRELQMQKQNIQTDSTIQDLEDMIHADLSIKFGRVDDDITHQGENYKKTRRVNIDGEYYLKDDDNLVYSYNKKNPTLMGKCIDGKLVTTGELLNLQDM